MITRCCCIVTYGRSSTTTRSNTTTNSKIISCFRFSVITNSCSFFTCCLCFFSIICGRITITTTDSNSISSSCCCTATKSCSITTRSNSTQTYCRITPFSVTSNVWTSKATITSTVKNIRTRKSLITKRNGPITISTCTRPHSWSAFFISFCWYTYCGRIRSWCICLIANTCTILSRSNTICAKCRWLICSCISIST